MFFVVLILLFRWLALFIAGGSFSFLIFQGSSFSETLFSLGFALFVWLLAKGIDVLMKIPFTFRFLDTRNKRIIAAIISFAMGFLFPIVG